MPIRDELRAAGIDPEKPEEVIPYLARLPIPRDRREGWLRLWAADQGRVPTIAEIELVRANPSP